MSDEIILGEVDTPAGRYGAVYTAAGLARLAFPGEPAAACARWLQRWAPGARVRTGGPQLAELAEQLGAYFAGRLRVFSLPLDLRGTPFQLRVWGELLTIGYGVVRRYAEVAAAIGAPRACRAVGAANGANPIPIIVPCHRLVGAHGQLIKYGGGLGLKRRLLALEHAAGYS
jgi:O-6-methylguanine DNA methyltransferase